MKLRDEVLAMLHGPAVARIRFRFPGPSGYIVITPQTFRVVANAIMSGHVKVRRPTDLGAGVGAQYNDVARTRADGTLVQADTLEVNSADGRLDQAMVLHESLHCAYDLLRTSLDGNAEESSCHICTALYCRMTGLGKPKWANGSVYGSAAKAAETLLVQYQKGVHGIPIVGIPEWQTLRLAFALHPLYRFKLPGGFSGLILGTQYVHDG
jgi:hypothetical protein